MDESEISQLLQACENGELETVRFIVEGRGVDVNITATYFCKTQRAYSVSDSLEIEEVSLLFIAAGNCKHEVIKYLLCKGANINSCTGVDGHTEYAGMTPLHAAISLCDVTFHERKATIELLIANGADLNALTAVGSPMWELCSKQEPALSILLIELGMNLTQRSPEMDKSVLHYWASSCGSFDEDPVPVVELILAKGTNLKALDKCGLTPLNVAAMGFSYNLTVGDPNEPVLRYLLNRNEISLSEKIDALELTGAMVLIFSLVDKSVSQAFQYWYEAQDLRDSGSIPKVPLEVNNKVSWRTTEWATRDQLQEIQKLPKFPDILLQGILVARRIFSCISSRALAIHLWFRAFFRRFESYQYMNHNNTDQRILLEVGWIMLEGARVTDLRDDDLFWMVIKINDYIVLYLKRLKQEQSSTLTSKMLQLSLELISETDRSHLEGVDYGPSHFNWYTDANDRNEIEPMKTIYNFVTILSESPEMVTHEIKSCLHQFVKRDGRDHCGCNLLLLACNRQPNTGTLATIRLLLEVGADANAKDSEGNSPLHLVAKWMVEEENDSAIAHLLLENGAHIDQVNKLQETPLDVWKKRYEESDRILSPPDWTNVVPSLACWSARSLRRSKTPNDRIPENLHDFVSMHKI